jgi:hypothetical protein
MLVRIILTTALLAFTSAVDSRAEAGEEVSAIEAKVAAIDSVPRVLNDNFLIFVKLIDDSVLVPVTDTTKWPDTDSIETTYNVMFDSSGRIVEFCEFPVSESGDWNLGFYQYYSPIGDLIMTERWLCAFSSGCTEVLCEKRKQFFGIDGAVIRDMRIFTSGGVPIDTVGCYLREELQCELLKTAEDVRLKLKH